MDYIRSLKIYDMFQDEFEKVNGKTLKIIILKYLSIYNIYHIFLVKIVSLQR